ncbi:MAG: hypothetical protein IIA70_08310 [Proteobacteria bacterium]|nr:hypothetical protein [Pseudomonadota bacterium]
MNKKILTLVLALPWFLSPNLAFADHVPQSILTEIWREANVPYCQYQNRVNGAGFDCTFEDPDWISCWVTFLDKELTYQRALDLLGQLKVSNTYFEYYSLPASNPYISEENWDSLMVIDFICAS